MAPEQGILKTSHFLSSCEVAQSCPILCDPMDYSWSGSSSHGIFQAGILEWIAVSFSRGPSWPKDWTPVCIAGRLFTIRHQEIPKYLTYIFSFQKFFIKFDCRNDPYRTFQVAQYIKNLPAMQEMQEIQVWSLGWEDPLEEGIVTHFCILA